MQEIPELVSPRLRLRGWKPTDTDALRRIYGDPQTMRHLGDGSTCRPTAPGTRLPRCFHLIRPENHASIRVAEKLGATFDERLVFDGADVDVYASAHPPGEA